MATTSEQRRHDQPPDWRDETLEQSRARLRRPWGDYPLTILVFNPVNLRLARWLGPTRVTPNQLTVVSFVSMLGASLAFVFPSWPMQAAGGLLLWLAYLVDCLDGDLARLKGIQSPLGAMLDPMLDRFGEIALCTGVATGGWRATDDPAWLLGGMALVGFSQAYFYLVDVLVKKLPSPPPTGGRALRGTRLRFGAIEPWLWGQAILGLFGAAWIGVPVFGAMFGAGAVGQAVRIVRRAGRLGGPGSEKFGTHVHDHDEGGDGSSGSTTGD